MTLAALLLLAFAPAPGPHPGPPSGDGPTARELALELTSSPRLAGTAGSLVGARHVARRLEQAGWQVELDPRVVMLSLPRRLDFAIYADAGDAQPIAQTAERFDPDGLPPGDVPLYNAWSASGKVRAPVVAVGRGLREDYAALAEAGVDVRGCIALARYGGAYRGVKVDLAAEQGCVGVLLYSDPGDDGAGRGEVWPVGPWKPDRAAQRGSISPMAKVPGDPSTPGTASPAGPDEPAQRLDAEALDASLPRIPCLPIGAAHAQRILEHLAPIAPAVNGAEGEPVPTGPGPAEASLDLEIPRELRTIYSVIARLPGRGPDLVLAGSHRDAWVRGANDSGSGVVALLRAARHLGARAAAGWQPEHTIVIGLWDGEEFGLIGSTEWAEAHAELLREHGLCYVNADACVVGTHFGASGTPGMLGVLSEVLARVPVPDATDGGPANLLEQWTASAGEQGVHLGLPGSGSDFAVFLHHLTIPTLDIGFGGNGGGQYHTRFDDFAVVDRFLDPGWVGHELAGRFLAELLGELAMRPSAGFDPAEAGLDMARRVRAMAATPAPAAPAAGAESSEPAKDASREPSWLGAERAERLAAAFESAAERAHGSADAFYRLLEAPDGLPARPWFRNRLWAPGLETGYRSEFLPGLRSAARAGDDELDRAVAELIAATERIGTP